MSGLDFTLAKGTRRSSLFKISQESRKKMVIEKKKLTFRRALRSKRRLEKRMKKASKKMQEEQEKLDRL